MKNNETEAAFTAFATLIVIFTAMLSPVTSLLLAISGLVFYGVYKYRTLPPVSSMRPFVLSALVACLFILSWSALHDILKGREQNYFSEYATLIFAFGVGVYLFAAGKTIKKHTRKKRK